MDQAIRFSQKSARGFFAAILQPFEVDRNMVTISASEGISLYPQDGGVGEDLLRKADLAMGAVKNGEKTGSRK